MFFRIERPAKHRPINSQKFILPVSVFKNPRISSFVSLALRDMIKADQALFELPTNPEETSESGSPSPSRRSLSPENRSSLAAPHAHRGTGSQRLASVFTSRESLLNG